MANAKEEFLHMVRNQTVLCAEISYRDCWEHDSPGSKHTLPVTYTEEEYNEFVNSLDFEYDHGYGGQELFGTVWFNDGTWADRGEYDGSEWWQHHICPVVPKSLLGF
jgi:hypothetical protein